MNPGITSAETDGPRVDYPAVCLHDVIATQAMGTPEAPAVSFGDDGLSYRELNERSNQLARHLRRLGVGPDVLVGICVERSLELVTGLLGILKAGGAYVPLDPEYPKQRLAFMLTDCRAPVLLTQERLLPDLPAHGARVICLDGDWRSIASEGTSSPDAGTKPDDLAYVIYTSGSTGQPKGAMNTHAAICNRLFWMQDRYHLTPADVVLQKTPFSFDVSVWEFFWPLMTGARLVLATPGGHKDSNYLARLIGERGITVLHFVPSMLQLFLETPGLEQSCASLRHVICSGEALSFELQERFFTRSRAELHNLYGPTEAAVDVTHWTCQRGSNERVVPIGRPVANTQIYVLDEALRPLPVGEPGELHIGGVQVARGYLNRPELTAARFIPDPFSPRPGVRLYKTGDLARFRPDGAVEFLGRIDHQVKIRGNRVELGEVEAVLGRHAAVKQAVVLAREDVPGQQQLVAYLVTTGDRRPGVSELRQHTAAVLPDYMVPHAFVLLDGMPLSPNGKVDRAALPAPAQQRPELERRYRAPGDELERLLAGIWSDVLGLERIGVDDKFFELGGTSLQAARFVNRMQQELGEFIYIVTIFEAPSIAEYAALLRRDYATAVARRLGVETQAAPASGARPADDRIDEAAVRRMRACIPTLPPAPGLAERDATRNPPALFVLSPPRSGTTLLRVMLAGHPKLFAAAELQLLGFNTLAERREAFSGKYSLWLEGTLRAVMELKQCDAEEAKGLMEAYEREGCTTKGFYGLLQRLIGNRMLVDKSPQYVMDPATLAKAERDFDGALYIHLVRHPYAMVRSFESYHMDQVLFLRPHPFSARQLGELVWTISQRNTLDFLATVPPHRQYRMRFEDLVSRPREIMEQLCATLGLEFHPDLLQPYKGIDRKMTDGIYADSTPMGDTKLLERTQIDPQAAEAWRGALTDDFLGDLTWELAASLGYERRAAAPQPPHDARAELLARRQARRRATRASDG